MTITFYHITKLETLVNVMITVAVIKQAKSIEYTFRRLHSRKAMRLNGRINTAAGLKKFRCCCIVDEKFCVRCVVTSYINWM